MTVLLRMMPRKMLQRKMTMAMTMRTNMTMKTRLMTRKGNMMRRRIRVRSLIDKCKHTN